MFDTKRNPHVLRGRKEQEELAKRKQESVMDLELDLLAPYLERYPDVNSLSKSQVNANFTRTLFKRVSVHPYLITYGLDELRAKVWDGLGSGFPDVS